MHPYEMQRLIRERKKDEFLDLKRGSLYQNIGRLDQAGLIAKLETTRDGRRPERTVYRLTEAGERDLLAWLRDLLANPGATRSRLPPRSDYLRISLLRTCESNCAGVQSYWKRKSRGSARRSLNTGPSSAAWSRSRPSSPAPSSKPSWRGSAR